MTDAPRQPSLSNAQKRHLKALAHPLKPIVHIGHSGVTDGLVQSVSQALSDHELIKIKVNGNLFEDMKDVGLAVAAGANAELVQNVGRVLVLFRRNHDNPKVELPRK